MQALGNDFVIIDTITQKFFDLNTFEVQKLSDRKLGIGFDQLLLVEKSNIPKIDFFYRIFNSNGVEVMQCGNGARCFAKFVIFKKLTNKTKNIYVRTKTRSMKIDFIDNNNFRVNMGKPIFQPQKIPFLSNKTKKIYKIKILKENLNCGILSIGNPHCVILKKNIRKIKISNIGHLIEHHSLFPEGVNVGFMQIVNKKNIYLRVYERGVGETKSCGSGACAAVITGINQNLLSHNVQVNLLGGSLVISWKGDNHSVYMTGPAMHVFDGHFYL